MTIFIVDPIQGGAETSINMNANEVITNPALNFRKEQRGLYKFKSKYPCKHVTID